MWATFCLNLEPHSCAAAGLYPVQCIYGSESKKDQRQVRRCWSESPCLEKYHLASVITIFLSGLCEIMRVSFCQCGHTCSKGGYNEITSVNARLLGLAQHPMFEKLRRWRLLGCKSIIFETPYTSNKISASLARPEF